MPRINLNQAESSMSSHIGMLIESAVTSALAFMIRGFFYGLGGGLALLIVYKLGGL